jgi:hypothetical protein
LPSNAEKPRGTIIVSAQVPRISIIADLPPLTAGRHAVPDKPKRIPIRLTPEEVRRDEERTRTARLALFNTWIDQAKDG